MRLEVGSIEIRDVQFGARTELRDQALVMDRDELRRLVLEDPHFNDVDVVIARPGESVRIIHALDVVEPRWKVAGPGGVFPGFVSPALTVGEGVTHRLAGVAVVETSEPVPGEPTVFRERLIDMAGPGAGLSSFGQTLNVVLQLKPNPRCFPPGSENVKDVINGGPEAAEYNRAVLLAGIKVAARLGKTAQDARPDSGESFELAPCDPGLLRVVCLIQELSLTPFLYGVRVPLLLGAMLHPNEYFDGAVARWSRGYAGSTYWEQNHEVLRVLCRRHSKELNFLGCIIFGGATPHPSEKEASSSAVAKLARLLGAQAALILGANGSNHAIDLMLTIQKCERAGIRTTLVYNDIGEGPDDPGFIFAVPEADAIVNAGSRAQRVTLPRMERVLGGDHLVDPEMDARGEITVPMRYLHGAVEVHGHGRLTVRFE